MGHYYADMMCDTCKQIKCTCPPQPEPIRWVVLRVSAFDFQARRLDTMDHKLKMSLYLSKDTKYYNSKYEAELAIPKHIEQVMMALLSKSIECMAQFDVLEKLLAQRNKEIPDD